MHVQLMDSLYNKIWTNFTQIALNIVFHYSADLCSFVHIRPEKINYM